MLGYSGDELNAAVNNLILASYDDKTLSAGGERANKALNDILNGIYGTYDNKYSTYWSSLNNSVKNLIDGDGFSDFSTNDEEISESGGIYIITENTELVKHVEYLIEHAELEL